MLIKSIMVKELVDATGYLVDVIVGQLQGLEGTQTFSNIGTWHTLRNCLSFNAGS